MKQFTETDILNVRALAGTIQLQHDKLVETIQALHTVRAHLAGASNVLNGILDRAVERARPATETDPSTMPRALRDPQEPR